MTDRGYKETAPQIRERLENLGLPHLVSQLILFSEFIPNIDIQTPRELGSWRIESWSSREDIPTILISNERDCIAYEVNIIGEENEVQKRKITEILIGKGERTELNIVEIPTEKLLEPDTIILSSAQSPNDQQP